MSQGLTLGRKWKKEEHGDENHIKGHIELCKYELIFLSGHTRTRDFASVGRKALGRLLPFGFVAAEATLTDSEAPDQA